MSTGFTVGFDCTHASLAATAAAVPAGAQLAGYVTGSPDICWTAADWRAHPDAVRIDQSPVNTALDETADILDVEAGAATLADIAPWVKAAQANFASAARPGQRHPAVYASASSITNVANALVAGGVTSGAGLWVANWNLTQAQAAADVLNASGPYPIIGVQFTDAPGIFDVDIFSAAWLADRSAKTPPPDWAYGPPQGLRVRPGRHNFHAEWTAPAAAPEAPAAYLLWVYRGTVCDHDTLVDTYPRSERGTDTLPDPGGLDPFTDYTLHVAATGPSGTHMRPGVFAAARFTTAPQVR